MLNLNTLPFCVKHAETVFRQQFKSWLKTRLSLCLIPKTSNCLQSASSKCVCTCMRAGLYIWLGWGGGGLGGAQGMVDEAFVFVNIVCFDVGCF